MWLQTPSHPSLSISDLSSIVSLPVPQANLLPALAGPKDRSKISCYYETQPSGCQKEDCPFLHVKDRNPSAIENPTIHTDGSEASGEEEKASTGVDPQLSSSPISRPGSFRKQEKRESVVPPVAGSEPKRKVITIETRKSAENPIHIQVKSGVKQESIANAPTPSVRVNLPNHPSKSATSKQDHRRLPSPSLDEEKPSFGVKSFVQIVAEKQHPDPSSGTKRPREESLHPAEPSLKHPRQDLMTEQETAKVESHVANQPESVESNLGLSDDQLDLDYEESLLNGEEDGASIDADNIDLDEELAAAGVL